MSGPTGTFDMAALDLARAALDAIMPQAMTVVSHPHMLPGRAWQMLDDGHVYFFIHPDDIASIPPAATTTLGLRGVPIRKFEEPEMREVFLRGLERMAAAEAAKSNVNIWGGPLVDVYISGISDRSTYGA